MERDPLVRSWNTYEEKIQIFVGWFDDQIEHVVNTTQTGVAVHRLGFTPHMAFTVGNHLLEQFEAWQRKALDNE